MGNLTLFIIFVKHPFIYPVCGQAYVYGHVCHSATRGQRTTCGSPPCPSTTWVLVEIWWSGPSWSLYPLGHLRAPNVLFLTFYSCLPYIPQQTRRKGPMGLRQTKPQDTLSTQAALFQIISKLLSSAHVTKHSDGQTQMMSELGSRLCFWKKAGLFFFLSNIF